MKEHTFRGESYFTTIIGVRTYFSFDARHWHRTFKAAAEAVGVEPLGV